MALAATLPHNDYFRASALGAGSFGSVVVVYNEDGQEFAAKVRAGPSRIDCDRACTSPAHHRPDPHQVFDRDDDDEYDEEDEDEEDESSSSCNGIDVGALREMSMLRYLNGAHPNVMRMVDVSRLEDQFCMIMPKLAGSLSAAIEGKGLTNKMKAQIAALLLHAVSWMASHCVMHRDIKPDNVLLTDESLPVLTDFSLAKLVEPASSASSGARDGSGGGKGKKGKAGKKRGAGEVEQGGAKQTAGMGTPTYTAPEIVRSSPSPRPGRAAHA
jgi:serine/threonine protein kinase